MSDTLQYKVEFNNRSIGLVYISENPNNSNERVATIVPIDQSGSWTDGDLTVSLTTSVTDYFSAEKSDDDVLKEITQKVVVAQDGKEQRAVVYKDDSVIGRFSYHKNQDIDINLDEIIASDLNSIPSEDEPKKSQGE